MKKSGKNSYDWVAAALAVELCDSVDLRALVKAADLDPMTDDLIDMDLSHMDLRHQDLSGWNLARANFIGARLANTNLKGSRLDLSALVQATDWNEALLDKETISQIYVGHIPEIDISDYVHVQSLDLLAFFEANEIRKVKDIVYLHISELYSLGGASIPIMQGIMDLMNILNIHYFSLWHSGKKLSKYKNFNAGLLTRDGHWKFISTKHKCNIEFGNQGYREFKIDFSDRTKHYIS